MRTMRKLGVAAGLLGLLCIISADGPSLISTSQAATAWNRLQPNRLTSNRLQANKLLANRLSSQKLSSNRLALDATGAGDLLATGDGRNVLSYFVSCALPADVSLVATVGTCAIDAECTSGPAGPDGTCNAGACTYQFPGGLGLAPTWADKKLSKTDKGWISACMLARVNAHDTAEEISLRGEHPALTISPDEALLFSVEEGAFYGNIFTPANKPIIAIACQGKDQASGEFGGLVVRDCAEPDPNNPGFTLCGFTFAGDCRDFTPAFPSAFACEEFESLPGHESFYSDCHDRASANGRRGKEFDQVITTFTAS